MKTLFPFLAATLALMPSAAPAQSRNSGKTHVRHIFVSVTDAQGQPVEGLAASDFNVTEGGRPGSSRTTGRPKIRCASR